MHKPAIDSGIGWQESCRMSWHLEVDACVLHEAGRWNGYCVIDVAVAPGGSGHCQAQRDSRTEGSSRKDSILDPHT